MHCIKRVHTCLKRGMQDGGVAVVLMRLCVYQVVVVGVVWCGVVYLSNAAPYPHSLLELELSCTSYVAVSRASRQQAQRDEGAGERRGGDIM